MSTNFSDNPRTCISYVNCVNMLGRRGIRSHANSKPARNEDHNYFNYKISVNVKIEMSLDSPAVCEFFENKYCFKCSIVSSKDV